VLRKLQDPPFAFDSGDTQTRHWVNLSAQRITQATRFKVGILLYNFVQFVSLFLFGQLYGHLPH